MTWCWNTPQPDIYYIHSVNFFRSLFSGEEEGALRSACHVGVMIAELVISCMEITKCFSCLRTCPKCSSCDILFCSRWPLLRANLSRSTSCIQDYRDWTGRRHRWYCCSVSDSWLDWTCDPCGCPAPEIPSLVIYQTQDFFRPTDSLMILTANWLPALDFFFFNLTFLMGSRSWLLYVSHAWLTPLGDPHPHKSDSIIGFLNLTALSTPTWWHLTPLPGYHDHCCWSHPVLFM